MLPIRRQLRRSTMELCRDVFKSVVDISFLCSAVLLLCFHIMPHRVQWVWLSRNCATNTSVFSTCKGVLLPMFDATESGRGLHGGSCCSKTWPHAPAPAVGPSPWRRTSAGSFQATSVALMCRLLPPVLAGFMYYAMKFWQREDVASCWRKALRVWQGSSIFSEFFHDEDSVVLIMCPGLQRHQSLMPCINILILVAGYSQRVKKKN